MSSHPVPKHRLTFKQIVNMSFGFFGIQFGFALQNANVSRIFQTLGADIDKIGFLWIAAPLTGLLVQPIIGYMSDRTWHRKWGRRRPFFFVGAVLASIALFLMPQSTMLWMAAVLLWVLDASINISMEPFRAFVGDKLISEQRTTGFATQTFFIGLGAVIASLLPYIFTNVFNISNTAPAGQIGDSVKYSFYIGAVVFFLSVLWTSCDCAISALTFNKRYTVAVASFAGIKVANSVLLFKKSYQSPDELVKNLKFPVFVKPNNGGSSIGMSKVNSPSEELGAAIEKAFKEDNQVLVEEFIKGREFTIGVFRSKGKIIALPITEVISKKEFFDYEAKYLGASEEITPAKVDDTVANQVKSEAIKIYQIFNCRGIVRIDFIYNEAEHQPYMLEINTVPGQTEASLVPQQVRAMGWTLMDFYTALIEECLAV
jgi:D-alanine-D-alanine ligase